MTASLCTPAMLLWQSSTIPKSMLSSFLQTWSKRSLRQALSFWDARLTTSHAIECTFAVYAIASGTDMFCRLHESEKQYTCAYCPNRFKNKNEAERHQNSLHLRRHSWSCAALTGFEGAFHPSQNANSADACGYCGEEFPNPPQWDVRAEHLNHVHKFGECNQAKKFFRADHFRQHLKHSHAGTSGKWTNLLETACMQDELPPERRSSPAPPTLMVTTTGLPGASAGGHGVLAETPHDS